MDRWFEVQHLQIDRLLKEWRWLCPHDVKLLARSVFGDLFVMDESGRVFHLDVAIGKFKEIASSEPEFRSLSNEEKFREEWFSETDERNATNRGLIPDGSQCIGFDVPLVFAESDSGKPYIADLYEYVSFLGDLNRQLADVPDGRKIRLKCNSFKRNK